MKIDQFIDEFNHLEQKDKTTYIANLQKKAGNGDMTALFLDGIFAISAGLGSYVKCDF